MIDVRFVRGKDYVTALEMNCHKGPFCQTNGTEITQTPYKSYGAQTNSKTISVMSLRYSAQNELSKTKD